MRQHIEQLLDRVSKPARYIGGELHQVVKDRAVGVRFAFAFPDSYEVGMSHLGMKILYHILNRRTDTWCERVFAPWPDMEAEMRGAGVPLFALESRDAIGAFDIIGFTLQYEMSYSNVLNMIDLAGLPVRACDRTEGPFVIAGGPCAFNPEPLAPFIDLFVIGDGEEVTNDLIDLYIDWKRSGAPRIAFLERAAALTGIYVPSFYEASYGDDGAFASIRPTHPIAKPVVQKAIVKDLDAADYPENIIVPYHEIVHDRVMLEVARGCTRGCRFCQAGMLYRPVRERGVDRLLGLAESLIGSTGYEEMSLSSLSTGDYSCLPDLARKLNAAFENRRVSLSLPSLRVDSQLGQTLEDASQVRKSGLTFAPEAGTQRLRDVINKGVTEEDLLDTVREAFTAGWSSVKLYFMIGLPTETEEDVLGIADMARAVARVYAQTRSQVKRKALRVSVSASSFVPKPHTPFQWCAQDRPEALDAKHRLLRQALRIKGVEFNHHETRVSLLEAVFAKGDRRLADVLETAWRNGCTFDGWSERFAYDTWARAFEQHAVDMSFYAHRALAVDAPLPWDHIDSGVSKAFLAREWQRAQEARTTSDCRGACNGCGLTRRGVCAHADVGQV